MNAMNHQGPATLTAISSMATKALLADLSQGFARDTGVHVKLESAGGVDVAKRVQSGEAFDLVFLAADAIERLQNAGHLQPGSRCDWVDSPVAVAVASNSVVPAISTEAELHAAVLAAPSLSYSTGPSGTYLEQLFTRWGVMDDIKPRIVVPPPGTPVASLVAQGRAALGFQQRSELMNQPGITVIGDLPAEVACITRFSAGIGLACSQDQTRYELARGFLHYLASAQVRALKQLHGMDWADHV
jgi:molybdate transport system substrate-binding protein